MYWQNLLEVTLSQAKVAAQTPLPQGSPFSQHRTGIDAGRRSRSRSRPYNGLASRLVHEQNLRGVPCFTHPPT